MRPLSESDTRAKLIDPALHARGWTEDLIRREETAGAIEIVDGKPLKKSKGRIDYTLRVKINPDAQPVAVALIEAKAENLPPTHGLEQAKFYAACKRLNVPMAFSSNGRLYVEYDRFSGLTTSPRPMEEFPSPSELKTRYEQGMGFLLTDKAAMPLLTRYTRGGGTRRYYQDAAIRGVLEKMARCEKEGRPNPENYFSHIVIDECHRSAWGKWSQVFTRNPEAIQIGLTATPRSLTIGERSREAAEDARITADNLRHFGEPVYEYGMSQGIEDGYLAACEIHRFDLFHDNKWINERESGVSRGDLEGKTLRDATTGQNLTPAEAQEHYGAVDIEDKLLMPERVASMTQDLFSHLLETGGPGQKTIIFCRRDRHADDVAVAMNNLYARWCSDNGRPRRDPYAFKCTASVGGGQYLADLRGASRSHFIATTVDLLTTGVDVPAVSNIVFFKYVRSPIAFYQMIGRGTRIHIPSEKLMFRVYDYTDATRLFGEEFITKFRPKRKGPPGPGPTPPPEPPEPTIRVEGFEVRVTGAGRYIVTQVDGRAMPMTVEEYKERLASQLVEEAPTLESFRSRWIVPPERREMLGRLPDAGRSALLVRQLEEMTDFDLYDVLAELGYGLAPKRRIERADAFNYKHTAWLASLPSGAAMTIKALASQFARTGTEGLENPRIFEIPEVVRAGGIAALRALGAPAEVLGETKARMFAA